MKRLLSLYFLFSAILLNGQGLIFDTVAFEEGKGIPKNRGEEIFSSASLKKYSPYIFTQNKSNCVAYSLSTARTILLARDLNITSKDTITALMFSPHWVYYRNKDDDDNDCMKGLNLEKSCVDVLNNGIAPMIYVEYSDYYPWGENELCNNYPDSYLKDLEIAKKFKLDDVYRLRGLEDLKLALSDGLGIIVGMSVPQSFIEAQNTTVWQPKSDEDYKDGFLHAMVIVSYDDGKYDGAVEILNSWGDKWGKGGYIWVRYDDLIKFTFGAYGLKSRNMRYGLNPQIDTTTNKFLISKQLFKDSLIENKRFALLKEYSETEK